MSRQTRPVTQEEYDRWRHYYPEYDNIQRWAKVPSQGLSNLLVDALKEDEKNKSQLTESKSVSSYSMDIEKLLPNRCHDGP